MDTADLASISTLGLSALQYEPERLLAESEEINHELESLVLENYRIFVENLTCSAQLRSEQKKLADVTKELNEELHGLNQQCTAFHDRVSHFVNSNKRNRKTLQHHMQLVELLEVPQLVDACARNGFHDEALELANFVNGLERRHLLAADVRNGGSTGHGHFVARSGGSVVQTIVQDVRATLLSLRQQLVTLMADDIPLPKQISLLSSLRKLDALLIDRQLSIIKHSHNNQNKTKGKNLPSSDQSPNLSNMNNQYLENLRHHLNRSTETRLQLDYLEARSSWLDRILDRALNDGLGGGDALVTMDTYSNTIGADSRNISGNRCPQSLYSRTVEMLEINRTAWFAIITHFNALFDEKAGTASASSIASAWMTRYVHKLLAHIHPVLARLDEGPSIRSVVEQLLYFAHRMAQVGGDFSPLVMPVVSSALTNRVRENWALAVGNFKTMLCTEKFAMQVEGGVRDQVVPLYMSQSEAQPDDTSGAVPASASASRSDDVPPPTGLLTLPPLAYVLNAFIIGLNLIREVPLLELRLPVMNLISTNVLDICHFLIEVSSDIRKRGSKYLDKTQQTPYSTPPGGEHFPGNGGSHETVSLDRRYAKAILTHLIPHVSDCFSLVFSAAKPEGQSGDGVAIVLSDHITLVNELIQKCKQLFINAGLIALAAVEE